MDEEDNIDRSVVKWCDCGEPRRFYNQHEYDHVHTCSRCGKKQAAYMMSWSNPNPPTMTPSTVHSVQADFSGGILTMHSDPPMAVDFIQRRDLEDTKPRKYQPANQMSLF